ncbi:hypothetical protein Micbo1qcDRAFT_209942 [Microdochium bolleyi]|uniref:Uncharacterized protein n=1 Tax=Microdochium bolleyi TaxID=196109 RepID=A0A136IKG4_9PEZI|nr:hypothetical protein Micbo1qcDRAFT_209942 [Microdochium bolleyi]
MPTLISSTAYSIEPTSWYSNAANAPVGASVNCTLCQERCDYLGSTCKGFVATATSGMYISYSVDCFLSNTTLPPPRACTTSKEVIPMQLYAGYRDDTKSCFSESLKDALRFCCYALGKPDLLTSFKYTATVLPVVTVTAISTTTQSACNDTGKRRIAVGLDAELPEVTPEPAAPTNPAQFLQPTVAPRRSQSPPAAAAPAEGPLIKPRAVSASPPACLKLVNYPDWNYKPACECLSYPSATTLPTISRAPTRTVTHQRTSTTSVQRPAIPTFKPNRPQDDGIAMHLSADRSLFAVTKDKEALKSYGKVSFVTTAGGITVIGELPDSTNGSGSANELYRCQVGSGGAAAEISCRLQGGQPAVFSEVLVPGTQDKYLIAVGEKAIKGARMVSLLATDAGKVILGCAGGSN